MTHGYREADVIQIVLFVTVAIITIRLAEDARRLHRLAMTDDLTGLHNLRSFESRLNAMIHDARRAQTPIAMLVLDVDRLKAINDAHGHLAGAEAVRLVGHTMAATLPPAAVACRYGGDEFAIAIASCGALRAQAIAEELREAVHVLSPTLAGTTMPSGTLSISVGIATRPGQVEDLARETSGERHGCRRAALSRRRSGALRRQASGAQPRQRVLTAQSHSQNFPISRSGAIVIAGHSCPATSTCDMLAPERHRSCRTGSRIATGTSCCAGSGTASARRFSEPASTPACCRSDPRSRGSGRRRTSIRSKRDRPRPCCAVSRGQQPRQDVSQGGDRQVVRRRRAARLLGPRRSARRARGPAAPSLHVDELRRFHGQGAQEPRQGSEDRVSCRWNSLLRKEPSVFDPPVAFRPTPANPIVFHMHGHQTRAESLVLTRTITSISSSTSRATRTCYPRESRRR